MPHDCNTMPMRSRSRAPPVSGSTPSTATVPAVRVRKPSRISTIVVLPAPFGPSSANTSPSAISKLTPRTASSEPYDLCRSTTSTARHACIVARAPQLAVRYASFHAERTPVPATLPSAAA